MTYLRTAIGEVIRELRVEKGMTLRDLSLASNVALGYLSEVERGQKEASSEILESISQGIKVQLSQIVVEAGYRLAGFDNWEIPTQELDKVLAIS